MLRKVKKLWRDISNQYTCHFFERLKNPYLYLQLGDLSLNHSQDSYNKNRNG